MRRVPYNFFTILQTSYRKPNVHRQFHDGDTSWFKNKILPFRVSSEFFISRLLSTATCVAMGTLALIPGISLDQFFWTNFQKKMINSTFSKQPTKAPEIFGRKEGWIFITFSRSEHVKFFLFNVLSSVKVFGMLSFHRPTRPPPPNLSRSSDKPNFVPQNAGRLWPKKKRRRPWRGLFWFENDLQTQTNLWLPWKHVSREKIRLFTI